MIGTHHEVWFDYACIVNAVWGLGLKSKHFGCRSHAVNWSVGGWKVAAAEPQCGSDPGDCFQVARV